MRVCECECVCVRVCACVCMCVSLFVSSLGETCCLRSEMPPPPNSLHTFSCLARAAVFTPVPCNPWLAGTCIALRPMGAAGNLPRLVLRLTLPTVALRVCVFVCAVVLWCRVCACMRLCIWVFVCLSTSHNLRALPVSQAFSARRL